MIGSVISKFTSLLEMALFIYVLLSYIMPNHDVTKFLYRIFEPILKPIREALYKNFPQLMHIPFDFSVLILYLAIGIFRSIIIRIF